MIQVDINHMNDHTMYCIIDNGLLAVKICDYRKLYQPLMNGSHMILLKNQIEDECVRSIIQYIYDNNKHVEKNMLNLYAKNIVFNINEKLYYANYDNYKNMLDMAYGNVAKVILDRIRKE